MPNDKKPKSIFSSVINDLVRSAIGANARQVSDQDLDSYVTDLITNEAKAKQAKYKTQGVRAYQPNPQPPPPSSNPLKPNKRFLMNIMKQTDSHNQAVIREAEENAKAFQEKLRRNDGLHNKGKRRLDDTRDTTLKRKRDNDDSDSDSDSSNSSSGTSSSDDSDTNDTTSIQYRGRGKVRNGSSMDKYFDDRYDATKDVDSDTEAPNTSIKPMKKKVKKSHHKHHKHSNSSSSSNNKGKKKKHRHRSSKKSKKER